MFIDKVKETLDEEFNVSVTENGAIGYRTTGKELLDINFSIPKFRALDGSEIFKRFEKAFFEDKALALKWLFYARDIRGGLGERRTFREILKGILDNNLISKDIIVELIKIIPEYGRYDDLECLLDTSYKSVVIDAIREQLDKDLCNLKENKSVSLLAKWLPTGTTKSKENKRVGRIIYTELNLTPRQYRKILSKLKKHIDIVERKMSANEWNDIDYAKVPSRANLIYNKAFLKHDMERRENYLDALARGETKINSSTLFPHDIVGKYDIRKTDIALEEMWKALPNTVKGNSNTIVVGDGSGSMMFNIPRSNVTGLDVANALEIYFAERCTGEFKDKYITFSNNPQLVDLSKGTTLRDKIRIARNYNEVAYTDIEKVFSLILTTAINNKMAQEDMPSNILIISDMEFNSAIGYRTTVNEKLFKTIENRYKDAGYKLPRLVFWNVNSRSETIPVKENELGVALVSGFSTSIVNMVLQNEVDPYKCLINILNDERYNLVEKAIEKL